VGAGLLAGFVDEAVEAGGFVDTEAVMLPLALAACLPCGWFRATIAKIPIPSAARTAPTARTSSILRRSPGRRLFGAGGAL
jgi:hypothetical protein